jgi:gamma-glutamyl hercynylcysteine S-oxide synthase
MIVVHEDVAIRHQLLQRIANARERSDALFRLVRPQSLYDRPIPERHRIIFYVGHLEAFDLNLLKESVPGLKSSRPEFDRLFAFGIDPVGGGLPSDQPSEWPSLEAVRDYVSGIRARLDEKLAQEFLENQDHAGEGFSLDTLLNVAIEHRLMHVETLTYMLHQLPYDKLQYDRKFQQEPPRAPINSPVSDGTIEIPAGAATLGLSRHSEIFGWDNEFEAHTALVPAFEIDRFMVTNGQYLDFMRACGYGTRAFWSDADWDWKTVGGVSQPVFWRKAGDQWLCRLMFEEVALPLDWPVYVSHAEAAAYARWAGKSLPREEQWHRAAYGTREGKERTYPWGSDDPSSKFGNFDLQGWDPVPVNAFPEGRSAFGVQGMLGNGWEWTSTVFAPFRGFQPFPFYRGYSVDFFDGKHFVMKGGSARTAACMLRPTFRNWFQPHYQYVYAGFRCVKESGKC